MILKKLFPGHLSSTLTLLLLLATISLSGETVKDRAGAVLDDRSNMKKNDRWIYNDWQRGFDQAKSTGKPLLVVLRCVPCLACMGIDASVLTEPQLAPLLEKFVCVRVMQANALDLGRFQFDYDLSFSTMFFNGDGTVYGRYGSWTHQKNAQDKTTAGFKRALETTLAIHRGFPANKTSLMGKQSASMPVNDPLELPELAGKYKRDLDWDGKVVQSCVHCHQVGDGVRSFYREQKRKIPREWIYPMPTPETVGLTLSPDSVARVLGVEKNSIAAQAGLQLGDEFLTLAGQQLISIADFSWALHRAPDSGSLTAQVKRGGRDKIVSLKLPPDWRLHSDISRRVGTWGMRAMALGGLFMEELSPDQRLERGINKNQLALFVKHAGEYGNHAAAKKAGFQKNDVLIELDGIPGAISESELIGRLLEKYSPGDKVNATVLRGTNRVNLVLPMQ